MTKMEVVAVFDEILHDSSWIFTNIAKVEEARDYVQSLIRMENNKASGAKEIASVAMNILKDAVHTDKRLQGSVIINGIQYVCNGSVLMAIHSPIDLPKAEKAIDYEAKMKPIWNAEVQENDSTIDFPDYPTLKANTDRLKAKAKVEGYRNLIPGHFVYTSEIGTIFNTRWLMYAVKATGTTIGHMVRGANSPVVFQGNGVTMLVLPIRDNRPDTHIPGFHFRYC